MSRQPDICDFCEKEIKDSDVRNQILLESIECSSDISNNRWDLHLDCYLEIENCIGQLIEEQRRKLSNYL